MRRALFGDTGYGLDPLGTRESVGKIAAADLRGISSSWPCRTIACWPFSATSKRPKSKAAVQKSLRRLETGAGISRCRTGASAPA